MFTERKTMWITSSNIIIPCSSYFLVAQNSMLSFPLGTCCSEHKYAQSYFFFLAWLEVNQEECALTRFATHLHRFTSNLKIQWYKSCLSTWWYLGMEIWENWICYLWLRIGVFFQISYQFTVNLFWITNILDSIKQAIGTEIVSFTLHAHKEAKSLSGCALHFHGLDLGVDVHAQLFFFYFECAEFFISTLPQKQQSSPADISSWPSW